MAQKLSYHITAERPAAKLWLLDDDGSLIDFSAGGYTFSLKVGIAGSVALLTKTSGITGAVGSGIEPTGTPNVTITWVAGEIASALQAAKTYTFQLTATITSLDRVFEGVFETRAVLT